MSIEFCQTLNSLNERIFATAKSPKQLSTSLVFPSFSSHIHINSSPRPCFSASPRLSLPASLFLRVPASFPPRVIVHIKTQNW
ncbi:hypothetical protein QUB80_15715 [Chlorogloeopsis sp. ULAP01]|uniref:hypothetical protein n=1 Tax=Chlorogloeopsis sp. ULAP01 TaxID=3056483 RepID=UPI0025AB006F|nr:hypothetical protein [Chlorogloeopsis sp. ULAP01]MDM9382150.1 hypothetical protein [Chlorogloeopsis sp. ULAP01]